MSNKIVLNRETLVRAYIYSRTLSASDGLHLSLARKVFSKDAKRDVSRDVWNMVGKDAGGVL